LRATGDLWQLWGGATGRKGGGRTRGQGWRGVVVDGREGWQGLTSVDGYEVGRVGGAGEDKQLTKLTAHRDVHNA